MLETAFAAIYDIKPLYGVADFTFMATPDFFSPMARGSPFQFFHNL
jgi:hypothetical protein